MTTTCANPLCNSTRISELLQRKDRLPVRAPTLEYSYRLLYCADCGLAYVAPSPSAEQLAAFYSSDYAYWQDPGAARLPYLCKVRLAAWRYPELRVPPHRGTVRRSLARVIEHVTRHDISLSLSVPAALPRSGRILDYGFGAGQFLLGLHALGFRDLHGADFGANAPGCEALRRAGIAVFDVRRVQDLPPGTFDCVRLEHVFEHLPDPVASGRTLAGLLKPGGLLVMTLPSIQPYQPVATLKDSPDLPHLQLPLHLWHHSMRSLTDFLSAIGLHVEMVRFLRPHGYLSAAARRTA
jgi:SAM-dependent methyltransferase